MRKSIRIGRRNTDISLKFLQLFKEEVTEQLTATIKIVVNGKIDKMDAKLEEYIKSDTKWKEDQEKKTAPVIENFQDQKGFSNVVKSRLTWLVLIGGAMTAFFVITSHL